MPADEQLNRTILPIPEPKHVGLTTYDAKDPDTRYPPIRALRPPKQAPNVVIFLVDDAARSSGCRSTSRETITITW